MESPARLAASTSSFSAFSISRVFSLIKVEETSFLAFSRLSMRSKTRSFLASLGRFAFKTSNSNISKARSTLPLISQNSPNFLFSLTSFSTRLERWLIFEALARSQGLTISEYVRRLVIEDLDKRSVFTAKLKEVAGSHDK